METVKIHDKYFKKYIGQTQIAQRTDEISRQISDEYKAKRPIFVVVLNGAFVFASEVFRRFHGDAEVLFVRVSSYEGTKSTGKINQISGIDTIPENRDLIVVEDIVDTGFTLDYLMKELRLKNPASIKIASLLFKPNSYKGNLTIDYVGFSIPNEFVVGYGLDYNYLGRNLPDIYHIVS